MADTSRTLRVIFDGSLRGLRSAAAQARATLRAVQSDTDRLTRASDTMSKTSDKIGSGLTKVFVALSAVSAVSGVVSTVSGVTSAVAALLPLALLLPGALLAGAAAYGVFKLATAGVSDALKGNAEAMAKLSPNAQAAVRAVLSFKPAFDQLRRSVQDRFFAGFAEDVQALGRTYLPLIAPKLQGIATGLNEMARNALAVTRTPFFQGDVRSILENTSTAISNASGVARNLLAAFVGLGAAGSEYLPRLGTAVSNVTERFVEWVDAGIESGRIFELIDTGIATFQGLAVIVSNVAQIIRLAFEGLNAGLEGGFLAGLAAGTAALRDFLATAQAQEALQLLGEALRAVAGLFQGVLISALQTATPLIIGMAPAVRDIATFLTEWSGVLGPIVVALVGLNVALRVGAAGIGAFTTVMTISRAAITAFQFVLVNVRAALLLYPIAANAAKIATVAWTAVQWLLNAALTANPIGIVVVAIAALVAGIIYAWNNCETFRTVVLAVWEAVKTGIGAAVDFIIGLVGQLGSFFSSIGSGIASGFDAVVSFFAGLPGLIGSAISSLVSSVVSFFEPLVTGVQTIMANISAFFSQSWYDIGFQIGAAIGSIISLVIDVFVQIGQAVLAGVTAVVDYVAGMPARIGAALAALGTLLVGLAISAWTSFTAALQSAWTATLAFIQSVPGLVVAGLTALGSMLVSFATSAWNGLTNALRSAWNATAAFVRSVPGLVVSFLAALPGQLASFASNAWNRFTTALRSAWNATVAFVRSIPSALLSALGNLGSLLVNAGRAVIDGLLSGIKSAVSAVYNFVSGIAAGIASRKGPLPYDRKVLVPAGLALMGGLLGGLKSGYGDVLEWVSGVAGGIGDQIGGAVSQASGLALAAGNVTVTAPQSSAESLLREIAGLLRQDRQTVINNYLDSEPIRGVAREEIGEANRELARTIDLGAGATF